MGWCFFNIPYRLMKKFRLTNIMTLILGIMLLPADSLAESSVECHPTELFARTGNNTVEPVNDELLCSFVEEEDFIYGVNALEITERTANIASFRVETTCKDRGLYFDRYISGFTYGGIGNYTVNIEEKAENFNALKITGTFYCVPSDVRSYCLPDHC